LLRVPSVGIHDNFFELGGHSLMAVHLFTRIHQEFGVNLPLATLFQEATIAHLADVIQSREAPAKWSSLIEIETTGDHQPFFCVHGITGDILWFRDLAHRLSPYFSFYGLQARGLDGVQEPLSRIEAMAALYISEIRKVQPKGPYFLGGASLGGTIALEIAQQLLSQGEEVGILAIFDHAPANVKIEQSRSKLQNRTRSLLKLLRNLPNWFKEFIQLGPSRMWLRAQRWLRLVHKLKGRSQVKNINHLDAADLIDFASELPEHRRKLVVSHFEALKAYDPKPYAGKVTLFRAIRRPLLNSSDPEQVWQYLTPGRVKVVNVPGSHEGMFKEPHVQQLAKQLKACIEQTS
jgi:thioesterase domain-containing protein/acyl carrier protein